LRSTNTSRGEFLAAATKIGQRIADQAFWHKGLCNWVGAEPVERRNGGTSHGVTHRALGPDLYSGSSGVALFLAELFRFEESPEFRRAALGAIRHALSRVDTIPAQARLGLFTGIFGIALSAIRVATLCGEPSLLNQAIELLNKTSADKFERDQFDLMSGRAGAIAALIVLHPVTGESSLINSAIRLGDELLEAADKADFGYSWKSDGLRNWHNLTGFSHGAAGAAYSLLELFNATGIARFRNAALRAFEYERRWFDPTVENWPDFRKDPFSSSRRNRSHSHMTFWCHGAPGIALSRLRAFEILGDSNSQAEAVRALRTTRSSIDLPLTLRDDNFSLCHGLTGNAEVLSYGAEILGPATNENTAIVSRVAEFGIKRYLAMDQNWPCGTHSGETPNMMLGLAGIGHFYLRLHDPSIPSILLLRKEAWSARSSAQTNL
jgi:type 2 lantibiotic biosynthesis protein LanM